VKPGRLDGKKQEPTKEPAPTKAPPKAAGQGPAFCKECGSASTGAQFCNQCGAKF